MSFHRSIAKIAHDIKPNFAFPYYAAPGKFGHQPWKEPKRTSLTHLYRKYLRPAVITFIAGPLDRWHYATLMRFCRQYGLLYDDLMTERIPIIERATAMMPTDLSVGRLRRTGRAVHLNFLKLHVPIEEQNYDPFVPYLAPYIEEAKFQMQEEDQLMAYHPWDRRLWSNGLSGFGEFEQGVYFLTAN